jgi:hypothetical protein
VKRQHFRQNNILAVENKGIWTPVLDFLLGGGGGGDKKLETSDQSAHQVYSSKLSRSPLFNTFKLLSNYQLQATYHCVLADSVTSWKKNKTKIKIKTEANGWPTERISFMAMFFTFQLRLRRRDARWFVFKPIWVNFGGSCNGKCWHIL